LFGSVLKIQRHNICISSVLVRMVDSGTSQQVCVCRSKAVTSPTKAEGVGGQLEFHNRDNVCPQGLKDLTLGPPPKPSTLPTAPPCRPSLQSQTFGGHSNQYPNHSNFSLKKWKPEDNKITYYKQENQREKIL
jgi:hypothetical protein